MGQNKNAAKDCIPARTDTPGYLWNPKFWLRKAVNKIPIKMWPCTRAKFWRIYCLTMGAQGMKLCACISTSRGEEEKGKEEGGVGRFNL